MERVHGHGGADVLFCDGAGDTVRREVEERAPVQTGNFKTGFQTYYRSTYF